MDGKVAAQLKKYYKLADVHKLDWGVKDCMSKYYKFLAAGSEPAAKFPNLQNPRFGTPVRVRTTMSQTGQTDSIILRLRYHDKTELHSIGTKPLLICGA